MGSQGLFIMIKILEKQLQQNVRYERRALLMGLDVHNLFSGFLDFGFILEFSVYSNFIKV